MESLKKDIYKLYIKLIIKTNLNVFFSLGLFFFHLHLIFVYLYILPLICLNDLWLFFRSFFNLTMKVSYQPSHEQISSKIIKIDVSIISPSVWFILKCVLEDSLKEAVFILLKVCVNESIEELHFHHHLKC